MLKWIVRSLLSAVVIYLAVNLAGLIPVNNDFEPSPDGIEILVISSDVHADIVVPITTDVIDWREHFPAYCFGGDTSNATHVAISWGDKRFFIETPTWADLRVSTAVRALCWPSDTCMHVSFIRAEYLGADARAVHISPAQYEHLVAFINSSFLHAADGTKIQIADAAYGSNDAFFAARGTYHCFNTCNSWVGRGLKTSGIRIGWLTLLPKSVYLYLPSVERFKREAGLVSVARGR